MIVIQESSNSNYHIYVVAYLLPAVVILVRFVPPISIECMQNKELLFKKKIVVQKNSTTKNKMLEPKTTSEVGVSSFAERKKILFGFQQTTASNFEEVDRASSSFNFSVFKLQ